MNYKCMSCGRKSLIARHIYKKGKFVHNRFCLRCEIVKYFWNKMGRDLRSKIKGITCTCGPVDKYHLFSIYFGKKNITFDRQGINLKGDFPIKMIYEIQDICRPYMFIERIIGKERKGWK